MISTSKQPALFQDRPERNVVFLPGSQGFNAPEPDVGISVRRCGYHLSILTLDQEFSRQIEFLALIDGSDTISYFDDNIMDWADITTAVYGIDYNLSYINEGPLAGTNILTVTAVPEPGTIILLSIGTLSLIRRKRS